MTKQEQFLWIVQTTILANGINLATQPPLAEKYRTDYSASGVLILADEAIRASDRIPHDRTAFQSANEFCGYMLHNLREGKNMQVPHWFAR